MFVFDEVYLSSIALLMKNTCWTFIIISLHYQKMIHPSGGWVIWRIWQNNGQPDISFSNCTARFVKFSMDIDAASLFRITLQWSHDLTHKKRWGGERIVQEKVTMLCSFCFTGSTLITPNWFPKEEICSRSLRELEEQITCMQIIHWINYPFQVPISQIRLHLMTILGQYFTNTAVASGS